MMKLKNVDEQSQWGGTMGSRSRIAKLEELLRKNIAMRDKTPTLGITRSGNIGIYGAHDYGVYVPSLNPAAVRALKHGGLLDQIVD